MVDPGPSFFVHVRVAFAALTVALCAGPFPGDLGFAACHPGRVMPAEVSLQHGYAPPFHGEKSLPCELTAQNALTLYTGSCVIR